MNEWMVVTVIIALVGLFVTVGKPIISLNKTVTTLNVNLEHYRDELAEQKADLREQRKSASDSHQKLWGKNDAQDKIIQDHETRISVLENNR